MRNWWKWLLGLVIVLAIVLAVVLIAWNYGWLGNVNRVTLRSPVIRPFFRPYLNPYGRGIIPFFGNPGGLRMAFGLLFFLVPACLFGLLLIGVVFALVVVLRPRPVAPLSVPPAQPVPPAPGEAIHTCPNCGRVVQADWSHCPYCGAPLK